MYHRSDLSRYIPAGAIVKYFFALRYGKAYVD